VPITSLIYGYIVWVLMASMNISIKKEAYDFLRSLKTKDRSFSDIILDFKKNKGDIMRFAGVLKDVDWDAREKEMREFRRSFNKRCLD
jgi:predicted CopG family antitoxin